MLPNGLSANSSSNFTFDPSSFPGSQNLDSAQARQLGALIGANSLRQANLGATANFGASSDVTGHFQLNQQLPLDPPSMSQNPAARHPSQVLKERSQAFLISLATSFLKRGQPLPPAITGVPAPNYDPLTSPFKDIEPGTEQGSFKLAGKDINIFQLWSMVWPRGGIANLTKDNGLPAIVAGFDIPESALPTLFQIYSRVLLPFENMFRQNVMEQQKKAQALRQAGASGNAGTSQGPVNGMPGQRPNLHTQHSSSSMQAVGPNTSHSSGLEGNASAQAILDGPTLDQDLQGLKRKLEAEEEGKRARQRTETDNVLPAESTTDQAFVGLSNTNPGPLSQALTTSTMNGPSRTRQELSRRKIEYKPLVREVETYGGRDLKAIEAEYHNASRRQLRDLNDWGNIDIDALTMSIRSRIPTELSYALTTFTLLSTMKGQQPSSGFPISQCPDLLEEVLDLIEDLAFGDVEDSPITFEVHDDPHIVTNREIVDVVYETETQPFAGLERRQGSKRPELGPLQRPANYILAAMNILRNLCVFADNVPYMASQTRMLDLMLRACGTTSKNSMLCATSPALSLSDLLTIRKDTLYTLSTIAPSIRLFEEVISVSTTHRIFHLIASYLVDPSEAVSPLACVQLAGVPLGGNLKPPALADVALEVFTRLGQSDGNRKYLSKAVSRPFVWRLFVSLVHRLPVLDVDFQLATRETWLSYVEKTVMALYSLGFLFPPELKAKVKADRSLGFKSVMMRMIQKLLVQNNPDSRQFFSVIVRRVIETMKVIDDGEDSFDTSKGTVSTLSFGMGYGEVGDNDFERGTGMLGGYTDIGWDMMLCREVNHDDVMFAELESLIRVEY